ncbi:MAG: 3'-5' exonuclease [Mariprofundaceae bacterium]|nr:3'-5' exonuclease [Mariprofundaceae bacterium]
MHKTCFDTHARHDAAIMPTTNDQQAIEHLQQSDQYRIIQRLKTPMFYQQGQAQNARIGLVIDTETTGLDVKTNKIIELGFIAFEYDTQSGLIYRILHEYTGFEDPKEALSDIVKQVTGISDPMLKDQHLNEDEINLWLSKAHLIIAHNAAFDRSVLERRFKEIHQAHWACTFHDIPWQDENISSLKLDFIAYKLGFFFDGHRAINDAQATLHILTRHLPSSGHNAMHSLLKHARLNSRRFFAIQAPFDKKDDLKARNYRWLSDFEYQDQYGKTKKGVWSLAVPEADIAEEQAWLSDHVYQGKVAPLRHNDITAKNRYSQREYLAPEL